MIEGVPREPAPRQGHGASIRDGSAGDLDAVMRVMESAFPKTFGEGWTRSQCAGILPMSGVFLRVAGAAADSVDGFSLARIVGDEAELLLIAVAPLAQRQGIGETLLDDFIARALAAGAGRLHLEVRDGNPAIGLYREKGFATAGRRRGYYHGPGGTSHDALTLVLQS